jgi:branched-chain amino acid transport system permease protein
LRDTTRPEVQWIIYGALMILIVFFLPNGIVPAVHGWLRARMGKARGGVILAEAP